MLNYRLFGKHHHGPRCPAAVPSVSPGRPRRHVNRPIDDVVIHRFGLAARPPTESAGKVYRRTVSQASTESNYCCAPPGLGDRSTLRDKKTAIFLSVVSHSRCIVTSASPKTSSFCTFYATTFDSESIKARASTAYIVYQHTSAGL